MNIDNVNKVSYLGFLMFQLLACQTKMANSHIFNSLLQRDFVVSLSDVSIVDLSKNMANTHFFQPL